MINLALTRKDEVLTVLNRDFGSCITLGGSGDERGDSGEPLYSEKRLRSGFNSIVLLGELEPEVVGDESSEPKSSIMGCK